MFFKPLDKMTERVGIAREDSDTSLFMNLLYMGEMLTKLIASGLIAAVSVDRQRNQYRLIHRLVHADGIGEWTEAIDDALTGPASQHLIAPVRVEQKELTQRCEMGNWQNDAVAILNRVLKQIEPSIEDLPLKVDLRRWFSIFAKIRNRTRGHGAPPSDLCSRCCINLEISIKVIIDNYHTFKRPWAYLHRCLSGKYRVTKLTPNTEIFAPLTTSQTLTMPNLKDGIYVHYGETEPSFVELIESNADALDFFFPNGNFKDKTFQMISYITGDTCEGDSRKYLLPATELPQSETQGKGILDVIGNCFSNFPPKQKGYVERAKLEIELENVLMDERHPVVTLVGRGGIGITWLGLTVLHKIACQGKYDTILWFSARDIDLRPEGPRQVMPHILSTKDIANEYVRLVEPQEATAKDFNPVDHLSRTLGSSQVGNILFVFDNFETVHNPIELYHWIDTFVRLPNKVLITTRFREFKGDFPVEVTGMSEQECNELVTSISNSLGINKIITGEYRDEIYRESDGHPYVIRLLLGEVAKADKIDRIERIVASRDEMLDALFERSYSRLTPVAKRVFLTLCNWRSVIPQLAIEAVLLRPQNERMDVPSAIDELNRCSFIEIAPSEKDKELFLIIPLAASVFGRKKLEVSEMKSAIEADTQLLNCFGGAQQTDIKHGIQPRVERLFRHIADRINKSRETLKDHLQMLEFIGHKYPQAWLLLSSLHEEFGGEEGYEQSKETIKLFLESRPSSIDSLKAWKKLADLYSRTNDATGEAHALVAMCQIPEIPFIHISNSANRLSDLFHSQKLILDTEIKQILVKRLVTVMEEKIDEGNAIDCSRLAWLFLHLRDENKAKIYTKRGLELDPFNFYCENLSERLLIT